MVGVKGHGAGGSAVVCSLIFLLLPGVTKKVIVYRSRPPPQLLSYAFISLASRKRGDRGEGQVSCRNSALYCQIPYFPG